MLTILLSSIIAILVIISSGALFYVGAYQPNQIHAQATATSVAIANLNTTATAQVRRGTQVQATATSQAQTRATSVVTGTRTALQNAFNKTTDATPVLADSLESPSNNQWTQHNYHDKAGHFAGSCGFTNGSYHVVTTPSFLQFCPATVTNFANLAYQVQLTMLHGNSGGLVIRADANGSGYYFRISTDGKYLVWRVDATQDYYNKTPIVTGQSAAVMTGNNAINILTIIATGPRLSLYVNSQYVNSASDSTYSSGQIGVYVESDTAGAEATFRNAKVWKA